MIARGTAVAAGIVLALTACSPAEQARPPTAAPPGKTVAPAAAPTPGSPDRLLRPQDLRGRWLATGSADLADEGLLETVDCPPGALTGVPPLWRARTMLSKLGDPGKGPFIVHQWLLGYEDHLVAPHLADYRRKLQQCASLDEDMPDPEIVSVSGLESGVVTLRKSDVQDDSGYHGGDTWVLVLPVDAGILRLDVTGGSEQDFRAVVRTALDRLTRR